jgi:hypothetical protein
MNRGTDSPWAEKPAPSTPESQDLPDSLKRLRRDIHASRHDYGMTDDDVLRSAAFDGFELEERACRDACVWGWHRGDDRRWSCYLEKGQALNWMRDRLNRGRVFA